MRTLWRTLFETSFKLADKSFCCIGCKTVYEILDENSLCSFYSLDSKAGLSQKKAKDPRAYAYLDDPEAREKLLEFDDGQSALVSFYLPQIHCISCIWLLEHLYKLDAGIAHSRVNFLKKTVSIQFNPSETWLRKIAAMLSSIGYGPEINLMDIGKAAKNIAQIGAPIGRCGICYGQYHVV